jgi:membrane fusion protein (multidrug efflux system)
MHRTHSSKAPVDVCPPDAGAHCPVKTSVPVRRARSAAPRRRIASWIVLAAGVALAQGCGGKRTTEPAPVSVATLTLKYKPITLTQEYPAQLEASNTVEIRPQVGGILYRQDAVEGTSVSAGQTLFEIDPKPYEAALLQAQAALAQAHAQQAQAVRDLSRAQQLSALDALSQRELDAAVAANASGLAQVKGAEAAVRTAQINLGYTKVVAPIDGVMSRALIRVGGVVTAYTTLLTTVYHTDPMYANFSVGELPLLQVERELGRPISQRNPSQRQFRILLADGSAYELPAKLDFVDTAVDLRTDTLGLRLSVPNPKQFLRAGQYVRVIVATRERPNALLLPSRAVQVLQDKNFVWVVDSHGKAQSRDVRMGQQLGSEWVVEQGLAPGDVVVVDGTQKLKAGTPVKAQPLPETSASSAEPHAP